MDIYEIDNNIRPLVPRQLLITKNITTKLTCRQYCGAVDLEKPPT